MLLAGQAEILTICDGGANTGVAVDTRLAQKLY